MYQPNKGDRVWVLPTNPSEPVQRAAHMYGQFLSHSWQECTWDEFLNARLHDGSILAATEPPRPPAPQEQSVPVVETPNVSTPVEAPFVEHPSAAETESP